jgi:hypothetical protein
MRSKVTLFLLPFLLLAVSGCATSGQHSSKIKDTHAGSAENAIVEKPLFGGEDDSGMNTSESRVSST